MVPVFYLNLEGLLQQLSEKFILKQTLPKADSEIELLFKINPKDVNTQKLLIKLTLDLLLSFILQNMKRKKHIKKAKYALFVKTLRFGMLMFYEKISIEKSYCSIYSMF